MTETSKNETGAVFQGQKQTRGELPLGAHPDVATIPVDYFFLRFARYFAQRRFAASEIALRPAADSRFVRLRLVPRFAFATSVTSAFDTHDFLSRALPGHLETPFPGIMIRNLSLTAASGLVTRNRK
jgi:hypothetical protein